MKDPRHEPLPPGYVEACQRMETVLRLLLRSNVRPLFRMPPAEIWMVADLDVEAIRRWTARNADAYQVTAILNDAAGEDGASLMMLRLVLDVCGVAWQPASWAEIRELGDMRVLQRGGKA
jgi:hypothetical protein